MFKKMSGVQRPPCQAIARRIGAAVAIAAAAMAGTPAASAAQRFYDLADLLKSSSATVDLGFASVTATTSGDGTSFYIDAYGLDQFASRADGGAFIDALEVRGAWVGVLDGEGDDVFATVGSRSLVYGKSGFRFDLSHGPESRLQDGEAFSFYWYSLDPGQRPTFDGLTLRVRGLSPAADGGSLLVGNTASAVPEPATATLMFAGLGVLGGIALRRRTRSSA